MSIISDDNNIVEKFFVKQNTEIKPEETEYDRNFENNIRPKSFDSYIGQEAIKETLKISIEAAKKKRTST